MLGYIFLDHAQNSSEQLCKKSELFTVILLKLAGLVVRRFCPKRRYHFHHHLYLAQAMIKFLCLFPGAPQ